MNKNTVVAVEISLKEAQGIWNTGCGCFFHEQEDRFWVSEEDQELMDTFLTYTKKDRDTATFLWVDTHLESLILAKVFRSNGYKAIELCDESTDLNGNLRPYVILVNVGMDALSELSK